MTTKEKEFATSRDGRGGRGRGGGGRGRVVQGAATAGGGRTAGGGGRGRGRGNNGRQPRQSSPQQQNQQQQHNHQRQQQQVKSTHHHYQSNHRSSTLKKVISGPYTHLFCSERHTFALSRVLYPRGRDQFLLPYTNNCQHEHHHQQQQSQRVATDDQLESWWECVKIVKCHIPYNNNNHDSSSSSSSSSFTTTTNDSSFLERCPICLDEDMVAPYIAPCGHIFCLPCAIGYLHSITKDVNIESEQKSKKPGANTSLPPGGSAVGGQNTTTVMSNRASITTVRARCPMCSSGSSTTLSAGDTIITYKDLRPVLFVPVLNIKVGAVTANNGGGKKDGVSSQDKGTRVKFVKLHRNKTCPAPYLPLYGKRIRGGPTLGGGEVDEHSLLPDYPDGDDDTDECTYSRQYFVGTIEYEAIMQRNLDDLHRYQTGYDCIMDSRELWNTSMAIEAIQAAQRRWVGFSSDDGGFRGVELEAKFNASLGMQQQQQQKVLTQTNPVIDDDATNEVAAKSPGTANNSRKHSPLLQAGSFLLNEDTDEYLFYQSSDGQPCYLSGFDVACLMHEFSSMPVVNYSGQEVEGLSLFPLPDKFTANIVEIEQLTVTQSLIKRKPFLSHLPLHSNVSFVEIDWYSGGEKMNQALLSHGTLKKFRDEIQRRKAERIRAAKREQMVDKIARTKAEKDELRQRKELLESNYFRGGGENSCQSIDPDDEFFQAPTASFDENEDEPPRWNRFNEVCATGGVWPELAASVAHAAAPNSNRQSLSIPSSPQQTCNPTWGDRSRSRSGSLSSVPEKEKPVGMNSFPSLGEASLLMQKRNSRTSR